MKIINHTDNMVVLWNKMTGVDSLTDRTWETMIEYHYEKFKYFHQILKMTNLQKILMVMVNETKTSLEIVLDFKNQKRAGLFLACVKEASQKCPYPWKHHFDIQCNEEGVRINTVIKNRAVAKEDELYHETISNTRR